MACQPPEWLTPSRPTISTGTSARRRDLESDSVTVWDLALFQVWLAGLWAQLVLLGVRAHPNSFLSRRMAQAMHTTPLFPLLLLHLRGNPGQDKGEEQRGRREQ